MMEGVTDQRTRLETDTDGVQAMVDEVFDDALPVHAGGGGDGQDGSDDGDDSGGDGRPDRPGGSGGRRRIDKTMLAVSFVVAVGLVLVVRGLFVGISADERAALPDLIDSVSPVPDAVQVLSQSNVVVDLASGHTGVIVIDGVEIETVDVGQLGDLAVEPGQQVELPPVTIYEPGNATLTFTPTDGAPIETFESGEHTATVIYWPVAEGRQRARSYTWTFTVV
jgi:hypothetical protein